MAPFQVLFIRNLKQLYTRGAKKEEFAALEAYFRSPNPQALVIFVADHLRIPSDPRRMELQDKDRYERLIRETLGDWCGLVELARVNEADALKWIAARRSGARWCWSRMRRGSWPMRWART
jgi:DNA polymerase III subunit delta